MTEADHLRALVEAGHSDRSIASILKISRSGIEKRRAKYGISPAPPALRFCRYCKGEIVYSRRLGPMLYSQRVQCGSRPCKKAARVDWNRSKHLTGPMSDIRRIERRREDDKAVAKLFAGVRFEDARVPERLGRLPHGRPETQSFVGCSAARCAL
jgi:hypothetical protein